MKKKRKKEKKKLIFTYQHPLNKLGSWHMDLETIYYIFLQISLYRDLTVCNLFDIIYLNNTV